MTLQGVNTMMLPCRAKTFLQQAGYPDGDSALRAGDVTISMAGADGLHSTFTASASSLVFPGDAVSMKGEHVSPPNPSVSKSVFAYYKPYGMVVDKVRLGHVLIAISEPSSV